VVPGHSVAGRMSARCRRILGAAAELAERRIPRVVVFSGWAAGRGPSEAEQMIEAWPGRRDVELVAEPTARTTAENASRSVPLLRDRGITEATVVCSSVHAPRVRYIFCELYRRFGIECDVLAARSFPTPTAVAWEVGALTVARRQRRGALAELDSALRG
jgi:uncharacterized SAM-binding protein YcdF (DUF218 family)